MELQQSASSRIIQLDFFRGIALMVIFINHMPSNEWFYYTPSRFGFSDAAEAFVFISGYAAAQAYGRNFVSVGIGLGTIRILHRCGQIYLCHLASFFLLAVICVFGNHWMERVDYIDRLNIRYFFDYTPEALSGLFTLHYVPNFFDILPMYLVMMLWIPLVWLLSRLHTAFALAFSVFVYWGSWRFGWELLADPVSGRSWYFNPFSWQLMFFTGFALGLGWLPAPKPDRRLMALAGFVVAAAVPLGHQPIYSQTQTLVELRQQLEPLLDKNHLGILRWVHFLAVAYLMNCLFNWKQGFFQAPWSRGISTMGRQALPTFLLGMGLSYLGGMALDWSGRDAASVAWVNVTGLVLMLLGAQFFSWLNSKPWRASIGDPLPLRLSPQSALLFTALGLLSVTPLLLLNNVAQGDLVTNTQVGHPSVTDPNPPTTELALQFVSETQSKGIRWPLSHYLNEVGRNCDNWPDNPLAAPSQEENSQEAF